MVTRTAREVNFDGLVGPTHNYAGLSFGNVASMANAASVAQPQRAALEGLEKMRFLHKLGIPQAVMPPHPRPDLNFLRQVGFSGTPAQMINAAAKRSRQLLHVAYSASSMWAANAATISPSADTADGKVHFTPANLMSTAHRSLEPVFTSRLLKRLFPSEAHFVHHSPLPATPQFSDEGAANHSRLATSHGEGGVEIFVYGQGEQTMAPTRFPARQHYQASAAIAHMHRLTPEKVFLVQQNPEVIDLGVFHNDVIAVSNERVLLIHERAWAAQDETVQQLKQIFPALQVIQVRERELAASDAVQTYLFNSQIVTLPDGMMALIAPKECEEHAGARKVCERIVQDDNPIVRVHYLDVRESMKNGGGPACLRLRVVLTEAEMKAVHAPVFMNDALYERLRDWVTAHYREQLAPADLADPLLVEENARAMDALAEILKLGDLYQRPI